MREALGRVSGVCLLVVASHVVAGEPLIVGANRDEVLERPSTAVTVLDEGPPRVLGGRDELSGGTWLAINEYGVCAGLTNQPLGDAKDPSKRSRGELPLELVRHTTAADAVDALLSAFRPADYNGSWLLVGDRDVTLLRRLHGLAQRRVRPSPCRPGSMCWRTGLSARRRPRSTWCGPDSRFRPTATRWPTRFAVS